MALGRRQPREQSFWVTTQNLPRSPGHPFYEKLNRLLSAAEFDSFVERLCARYYSDRGRPSIPPGVYFRMLFVGYFEGIASQRGIAWRCSDSLALRDFLGLGLEDSAPDHSSLTVIRKRLSAETHEQVFLFVLELARAKGLMKGKTVAVDTTTLEANAAMKAIVRRDSGDDWRAYLTKLAQEEEGLESPSDEELRRFDKRRKKKGKKKVSNKEWVSPADPSSRITRMKDGRTHLAYKAEHVIDLDTELVLAAEILHADAADSASVQASLTQAQANLASSGSDAKIKELVADKGYHKAETLAEIQADGVRTYIPEPKTRSGKRRWTDKPEEWKDAVYANRRRVRGSRSKKLQRKRSEKVERSFAHTCETGGGRRTWIRGLEEVGKRLQIHAAARNLGLILRKLFGVGTPRSLQGGAGAAQGLAALLLLVGVALRAVLSRLTGEDSSSTAWFGEPSRRLVCVVDTRLVSWRPFSTGC